MENAMITTAPQAFTFCAGSLASRTDVKESQRYANVFRTIADLCSDVPGELPSAHVVAFALVTIGHGDEGYQPIWREVGDKLQARLAESPKTCEPHELRWCSHQERTLFCIRCGNHDVKPPPSFIPDTATRCRWCAGEETPASEIRPPIRLLKPAPESGLEAMRELVMAATTGNGAIIMSPQHVDVEFVGPRLLEQSIWLWQMLIHACECRVSVIPQILQNAQGQLAIQNGSLLQPISQLDAQRIQHDRQALAVLAAGMRAELRVLIENLCPERTEAIKKAVVEQMAKMQTEQEPDAQREPPRLSIVKD